MQSRSLEFGIKHCQLVPTTLKCGASHLAVVDSTLVRVNASLTKVDHSLVGQPPLHTALGSRMSTLVYAAPPLSCAAF